ncbi:apolipo protein O-domain-containing protein [Mrakia frigida]|uniref:apolipo protein O-domain-containing protein n=1 Tax=Mrakia frigida TaxID=29902 RepID=UPI003FCC265B
MNSLVSKVAPLAVGSIALGGFVVSRSQPVLLEGEFKRERLPIYPQAQPQIVLVEESSALTSHIATGREATTSVIQDIRERTQAVVSRVVAGERRVVHKVDSLIPKDEPLNPGLLWVLVSTLSGSIIARNRMITTRLLLPPTIFLLALPTFLPKLASNLSTELSTQTSHYAPELHKTLSESREALLDKTEDTRDFFAESRISLGKHLGAGVQKLEETTGLQLAQAWRNQASSSSSSSRSEQQPPQVVVVSQEAGREVTVPLYDQHSSKQVIPGTNTVVSHTTPNSQPTEVLSVPVYKQVGGPLSTKEKVDAMAAKGLDVLERKGKEVLGEAEQRAAEAKAAAMEKLREGKEKVEKVEERVEERVKEVKENMRKPEVQELKVDEVVVDKEGKKVEEVKLVSGYKKLV